MGGGTTDHLKVAPGPPKSLVWQSGNGIETSLKHFEPLIDHQTNLLVYWSRRSACTSVYAWFSAFAGFGQELRDFYLEATRHARVGLHQHRINFFNRSEFYAKGLAIEPSQLFAIRVLRDPFERAVSIYRHALATGFADEDVFKLSGIRVTKEEGFSFRAFLSTVDKLDMNNCDKHYTPQTSIAEIVRKPDHIINISKTNMFTELNKIVLSRGMKPVDLDELSWLHSIEKRRRARTQPLEGDNLDMQAFGRMAAIGEKPFPSYGQLLTQDARDRIRKIYDVDFENYAAYL